MIETDLAWTAGIIDGEGCIRINKSMTNYGRYRYQAILSVTNSDLRILNKLKDWFGGNIYFRKDMYFQWGLSGKNISPILVKILPWLISKKEEAELTLDFIMIQQNNYIQNRNRKLSNELINEYDSIYEKVSKLKHKLNGGDVVSRRSTRHGYYFRK